MVFDRSRGFSGGRVGEELKWKISGLEKLRFFLFWEEEGEEEGEKERKKGGLEELEVSEEGEGEGEGEEEK